MRFRLIQSAHRQSILLVVTCLVFVWSVSVHAQTPGVWDGVWSDGAIVAGSTIVPVAAAPRYDSNAQLKCVQKKIPTRRGSTVSSRMKDGCWYNTKWGLLERGGTYLVPHGYDIAGSIYVDSSRYDGRRYGFHPTQNSDVLIHSFAVANGMNIYRRGDSVQFTSRLTSSGDLNIQADFSGATASNTSMSKLASNSYFSDNGRWAVRVHDGTVTRYDMESMSSVTIVVASVASRPAYPYADVDDSGRYIVFSLDNSQDAFKVIDLDACTIPADTRDVQASGCLGIDLRSRIVSELGYTPAGYGSVRFIGDSIIQGWAKHPSTGQWHTFHVYAPSVNPDEQKYLALGDSFASGEGAYSYVEGTDIDENKCHLSTVSYSYLFKAAGAVAEMHSLACSGARMENVHEKGIVQHDDTISHNPDGSFTWLPGSVTQLDKSSWGDGFRPTVVTVSISGNDIGFADKIKECVLPQLVSNTCFDTYAKRLTVAREILSKHDELVGLYDEIKETSAPNARVYAVGYPQIVDSEAGSVCDSNVLLNDAERTMAYDLVTFFNAVIRHAAATAGVQFVGVEGALGNHKLCGESTEAVNGFTRGDDGGVGPFNFVGKESYHPNQLGHKLLYDRIKDQTNNLTSTEVASPGAMPDPANYPFLSNMESTDTPVVTSKSTHYLPKEDTVALRGSSLSLNLSNLALALKPNAIFTIELHSDPVQLGTVTSNGLGEIIGDVVIPVDVEPGLHSMHILGSDENGEAIDIYEYLYVAAAEDDFDGDGILDTDEPCGIIEPSGADYDQDGVDDACDAEIGQPPEPTPDPVPEPEPEDPIVSLPTKPASIVEAIIAKVIARLEEIVSYTRPKIENVINQYVSNMRRLFGWLR